jgi:hypothetical protein
MAIVGVINSKGHRLEICEQSWKGVALLLKSIPLFLLAFSLAVGQSTHQRHRAGSIRRQVQSTARGKSSRDLVRLTERLRRQSAAVVLTNEKVSQPFFSVSGRIVKIHGEAVQVFEYRRPSMADADAKKVSADGSSIGTSKPSWVAPPHFFKSGKFLVLYVGGTQTVLNVLQGALGSQFAGA